MISIVDMGGLPIIVRLNLLIASIFVRINFSIHVIHLRLLKIIQTFVYFFVCLWYESQNNFEELIQT